ncbi:hypothetical protein Q7P37_000291 [Cladosporium fusiforme]
MIRITSASNTQLRIDKPPDTANPSRLLHAITHPLRSLAGKYWPARAILGENKTQYLIRYEPVDESAQCEELWQPKRNASLALIAAWEERGMTRVGDDDSIGSNGTSSLPSDVLDDTDKHIPPDVQDQRARSLATSKVLHACTQGPLLTELEHPHSASSGSQQPILERDHVTDALVATHIEGVRSTIPLRSTPTSVQGSPIIHSPGETIHGDNLDGCDTPRGPGQGSEPGLRQYPEKRNSRPGTTISSILSAEPSAFVNKEILLTVSSSAIVEDQTAPSKPIEVQGPHGEYRGALSVPSGKLPPTKHNFMAQSESITLWLCNLPDPPSACKARKRRLDELDDAKEQTPMRRPKMATPKLNQKMQTIGTHHVRHPQHH